jgi:hypothetical protein
MPTNFVQIWRTGDRTPGDTYPSDVYQEAAWPGGFDQVTPLGMQQAVRIGQLLQNVYIRSQHFIAPVYQQKQVRAFHYCLGRRKTNIEQPE